MIKSKTKKTMNNPSSRFNPARLVDQITESLYATGLGKGTKLKNGRQHRVDWLRKKYKDDQPSHRPGGQARRLQAARPAASPQRAQSAPTRPSSCSPPL